VQLCRLFVGSNITLAVADPAAGFLMPALVLICFGPSLGHVLLLLVREA
jgi:hypothetical protein